MWKVIARDRPARTYYCVEDEDGLTYGWYDTQDEAMKVASFLNIIDQLENKLQRILNDEIVRRGREFAEFLMAHTDGQLKLTVWIP